MFGTKPHKNQGAKSNNHESDHQMMAADFRKRFVISGLVTIPILILSPTIQRWIGFVLPEASVLKWVLFLLASFVALWGAKPFYVHAWHEGKRKQFGMMTLVSLAVGSGYLYSAATTFIIHAPDFYWEISTLTVFLLFGHWMEMRSVIGAGSALRELVKLIPPKANLVDGSEVHEVKTESLKVDDHILIRPGEKIPIDGVVIEGASHVNEAMLTGESKPVEKKMGMHVIGGALNIDGSLTVRVTQVGRDTALSQIVQLVQRAQESQPKTQQLADRAAHYLTLAAIVVGALTLFVWSTLLGAPFVFALTLAITVIVITCPHALGLAIPIVTTVATTLAAKHGILIRDMNGLDAARRVDYVLFDKTGTLTTGMFGVTDVIALNGQTEQEVLRVAASVDQHSEHVIAQSVVTHARLKKMVLEEPKKFSNVAGKGVKAFLQNKPALIGNRALMDQERVDVRAAEQQYTRLTDQGKTTLFVAFSDQLVGLISLSDTVKKESKQAIRSLKNLGLTTAMITGDNERVAASVAKELKIDHFFSDVLPNQKIAKVKELQKQNHAVMMVGDGVNDAPALTQADVGVAIGAGTDVAVASSEIVLVNSNPLDVVQLIQLSKRTHTKMAQNLVWATAYNIIAIPIAAGALAPFGIFLRPEWGALVMSVGSVIVVTNALFLKHSTFT